MEYRKLGRTGLDVSVVGLGLEYLNDQPRDTVVETIQTAIAAGVNYFDVIFSFPDYLDNMRAAFAGQRERVLLTGHLGSMHKNGQYMRNRNPKQNEAAFLEVLARLQTDYVDVLFLHNINTADDYKKVFKPNAILDLARRLQQEGKARFIGFSGHNIDITRQAVETGAVDVLMFPINLAANAVPGKKELLQACASRGVGVVAMKPYGGGKLLNKDRTVRVGSYQMGGEALKLKKTQPITPAQCLSYALAQVGVVTAVPGCKDPAQVAAAVAYAQASADEKDFAPLVAEFQQYVSGECVYCNHCLPCPEVIDIGQVTRLLDMARQHLTDEVRAAYNALAVKASACTECGACVKRCPFGVDVIANMRQAAAVFA
jgi:uncharacterized protein